MPADDGNIAHGQIARDMADFGKHPQVDDDVFTDDFGNNDNEWLLLDEDESGNRIRIFAGRLWISVGETGSIIFTEVPVDEDYDNFSMVVDGSSSDSGVFSYDIAFRADEDYLNGYVFSIEPTARTYRLDMLDDGEWTALLQPRTSPQIRTTTPNTIGIEVDGEDFSFSINDMVVATYSDDTFSSGKILLSGTTFDSTSVPISVSFDNIEIGRGDAVVGSTGDDADEEDDEDSSPSGDGAQLGEAIPGLVESVQIGSGGAEVFPLPSRSSGRIFAAAGVSLFAPHVAGRTEEGDWVYIYFFDEGELLTGWMPTSQMTLTDEQFDTLFVVDPDNPPDLPDNVPYDDYATRPRGARATPIPDRTPVLVSVTWTGSCANLTFQIQWTDPDGNGAYIDINGEIEGIGGGGGTHVSPNWFCTADICRARITVVDAEDNRSNTRVVTISC